MARAGTGRCVQLYDVSRSKVIRSISRDELNRMAASGSLGWFERKGKVCACVQPIPMQSRTSNSIHSTIPLVQTDMELNAEGLLDGTRTYGLNRFGEVDDEIVGNRVDQAMSKVETWPFVFDERNVSVCAGVVHGARHVNVETLGTNIVDESI